MTVTESDLLQQLASSFATLDDLVCSHSNPPPKLLFDRIDEDDWNILRWKPRKLRTTRAGIDSLRHAGPLPTLFETFAIEYAWLDVDLSICRLFSNPPVGDVAELSNAMFADPVLNDILLPVGLVRFALASDGCYDPVCFDLNRSAGGDCPVVRLTHESILTHGRIGGRDDIFDSFRDLALAIVAQAETRKTTEP